MPGVPGIGGGAVGERLGGDRQPELGRVGAPEVHQAQLGEHGGQVRGAGRDVARVSQRHVAGVVGLALGGAGEVFGEERHACQRAAGLASAARGVELLCRAASAVVEPPDDSVDLRVQPVCPCDGLVEQFDRRRLARGAQLVGGDAVGQVSGWSAGRSADG